MRTVVIDPIKAIRLHDAGKRWREIGCILAAELGRPTPFLAESVRRAVREHDLGRIKDNGGTERGP